MAPYLRHKLGKVLCTKKPTGNPGIPIAPLGPGLPICPQQRKEGGRFGYLKTFSNVTTEKKKRCTCSPFGPGGPGNPAGPRTPCTRQEKNERHENNNGNNSNITTTTTTNNNNNNNNNLVTIKVSVMFKNRFKYGYIQI